MKVAIVTGASSGLGKEFVNQIAEKYSKLDEIWVIARRKDRLVELQSQYGNKVKLFDYDLTDRNSLKALYEVLESVNPDVKILVNAAGYGIIGPFSEGSYDEETGMIDINCHSLTAVTYMVLPHMSKKSKIINFASSAAFLPQPGFAVYAATKSYVLSFSRALALELKERGIVVTAVCPGPVKTEFFDVAEKNTKIKMFKKLFMVNPKKVVQKAISDSTLGKELSVYGIKMKAFHFMTKVLPNSFLMKISTKL